MPPFRTLALVLVSGLVAATLPAAGLAVVPSTSTPTSAPAVGEPSDGGGYDKLARFAYEPEPFGGYTGDESFDRTPEDGAEIPYSGIGHAVPLTWTLPDDPTERTGFTPAWTSAGKIVRFDEPSGFWTEVAIEDDHTMHVTTSEGVTRRYGGPDDSINWTLADFARCTVRSDGACARFANDTEFSSVKFLAREPGTYTFTLTIEDVEGGSATYRTSFDIVPRPPGAPRNVVALPGTAPGQAFVLWEAPLDDGGAAVEYYKVYRAEAGGEFELVGLVQGASWQDDGLATGLYAYRISAVNVAGEGAVSRDAPAVAVAPAVGAEAAVTVHALGEEHHAVVRA